MSSTATDAPVCTDEFCIPGAKSTAVAHGTTRTATTAAATAPSSSTSSAASVRTIPITVVSDAVCPWCFVGKRRLERAMAKYPADKYQFKLTWQPFFLNPDAPKPSVNRLEMYKSKFGAARMAQMLPYMQQVGQAEGIRFSFGGNTGNTMDAHRLAEYALEKYGAAKQNEVVEKMFTYYFEQERDIVDTNTLVEAAESVGLNGPEVRAMLANNKEYTHEVREKVEGNYARQITGVPFFIIDDKYALNGAQDSETFEQVFDKKLGLKKSTA